MGEKRKPAEQKSSRSSRQSKRSIKEEPTTETAKASSFADYSKVELASPKESQDKPVDTTQSYLNGRIETAVKKMVKTKSAHQGPNRRNMLDSAKMMETAKESG